jgi:tetratricopeptide (TPR) repeat protein
MRSPLLPALLLAAFLPASPSEAAPAPCGELVVGIPAGTADPDPFLRAASCLRDLDSAGKDTSRAEAGGSAEVGAAESSLRRLLPPSPSWYATHLERLRARRDIPRLLDMAWLAELRNPPEPEVWQEIAEAHLLAGDPFRSALARLRQAECDSLQARFIQYQLENLLRAAHDVPTPVMLDSLTDAYTHRKAVTAEILENLCWANRHHAGAYRNALDFLALRKPPPRVALDRAGRFQAAGWWDHAAGILEKAAWRRFPMPQRAMARTLFLRVRHEMQDWDAILAETLGPARGDSARGVAPAEGPPLSEEEDVIVATALVNRGRAAEAAARLDRFKALGSSEWAYRGRILKSRALIALGRLDEAGRLLDALKRSPRRMEGTGPILFWQGWLALQQRRLAAADSLLVLASAYTGTEESQKALEYRYFLLLDTTEALTHFFQGMADSPLAPERRLRALDRVPEKSPLWTYARLEKAQILVAEGRTDSARAVLDHAAASSKDRHAAMKARALSAYLLEKTPEGRREALARYEDLLIEYQRGVIPEFSRGRIRALK